MKIGQLIKLLLKYLSSREVKVVWEGQVIDLKPENIYKARSGAVIIDADGNYYKEHLQDGRK